MGRSFEVLTVRIGGDMSEVLEGLNRVGASAQRLSKQMGRAGRTMTRNVTAPLAAVGAAAAASSIKVGNMADTLLDLEAQTGLTTTALQEMRRVATIAGVAQDTLAEAAKQMTLRLSRGAEGSADLRAGLRELGIELRDSQGSLRPMSALVNESVAALAEMEDVTARNVIATKLFSRRADDLAPILALGADEIARVRTEAHSLGLVLERDALVGANAFRQEWDTIRDRLAVVGSEIGLSLVPLMSRFAQFMGDKVVPAVQRAVRWFDQLDERTVLIAAGIAGVAASIGPLLVVGGKLTAMLGLVLSPAGLVVAAMASLASTAAIVVNNWDVLALQGTLAWTALKEGVFDAVSGMLGAFESLPLVGEKMAELRARVDELSEGSLVAANERILELESRLNSAGAAMASVSETATAASVGLDTATTEMEKLLATMEVTPPAIDRASQSIDGMGQAAKIALPEVKALRKEVKGLDDEGEGGFFSDIFGKLGLARGALGSLSSLAGIAGIGIPGLSGATGLLSSLGGFAGFFADGGHIPAGQFGFGGEAGAEIVSRPTLIKGPADVTPVGAGSSASFEFVFPPAKSPTDAARDPDIAKMFVAVLDQIQANGWSLA